MASLALLWVLFVAVSGQGLIIEETSDSNTEESELIVCPGDICGFRQYNATTGEVSDVFIPMCKCRDDKFCREFPGDHVPDMVISVCTTEEGVPRGTIVFRKRESTTTEPGTASLDRVGFMHDPSDL